MLKRIQPVAIAIALVLCGHISDSRAGCVEIRKGDVTLIGDCDVGFNGNQNLPMQLANASGDDNQIPISAGASQDLSPTIRGFRRYVCTPSGFGHIASCSPRGTN